MNTSFDIWNPLYLDDRITMYYRLLALLNIWRLNMAAVKMAGNCPSFTIAFERSNHILFVFG